MEQETIKKISKEMIISDILASFPSKSKVLSEVLIDFGIHCVGCGASGFETLEEGVLGHGFTEEELNNLVDGLNEIVSKEDMSVKEFKMSEFSLNITDKALSKVKEIMKAEKKEGEILRVAVLAGGCSGYTYDLEVVPSTPKTDLKFKKKGLEISIDRESLEYLNGSEIDFVESLKENGFKFNNPNATKECGCGKSFS